jgi:hypothetical protein
MPLDMNSVFWGCNTFSFFTCGRLRRVVHKVFPPPLLVELALEIPPDDPEGDPGEKDDGDDIDNIPDFHKAPLGRRWRPVVNRLSPVDSVQRVAFGDDLKQKRCNATPT